MQNQDYFLIKLYKNLGSKSRAKTLSQLKKFFEDYEYDKVFTREDIKTSFGVQNSRASEIIALLVENNMVENIDGSKYKFKR